MPSLSFTITVAGELDERFGESFGDLTLNTVDGRSELSGPIADQSELQGLLRQLFDLGLEVLSFTTTPAADGATHP